MLKKEKGIYLGLGLLIGVGIGLISSTRLNNIGNIDKLTIININKHQDDSQTID